MTGDSKGPEGHRTVPNSGNLHNDETTDALGAEAARLAEAFTAWVGERATTDSEKPHGADEDPEVRSPISDRSATEPATDDSAAGDRGADDPAGDESGTGSDSGASGSPVCGCNSQTGVDVVCRMCPICRAAEFLHTVRPEVLERCADVLAMIAGSLQAIAADRPAQPSSSRPSPPPPSASRGSKGSDDPVGASHPSRESESGISIPVHGDDEVAGDGADERED